MLGEVLDIFSGWTHAEFFSQFTMHLSYFLSLLFVFKFEFSAHLVHWVANGPILNETTLLVILAHNYL